MSFDAKEFLEGLTNEHFVYEAPCGCVLVGFGTNSIDLLKGKLWPICGDFYRLDRRCRLFGSILTFLDVPGKKKNAKKLVNIHLKGLLKQAREFDFASDGAEGV